MADGRLSIAALLGSPDGKRHLTASEVAEVATDPDADALGSRVGEALIARGGLALIESL
jgi:hypothetical protein